MKRTQLNFRAFIIAVIYVFHLKIFKIDSVLPPYLKFSLDYFTNELIKSNFLSLKNNCFITIIFENSEIALCSAISEYSYSYQRQAIFIVATITNWKDYD